MRALVLPVACALALLLACVFLLRRGDASPGDDVVTPTESYLRALAGAEPGRKLADAAELELPDPEGPSRGHRGRSAAGERRAPRRTVEESLADLRPISADVVDPFSGAPVPLATIFIRDVNGVELTATTDVLGRIRSPSVLVTGAVQVWVEPTKDFPTPRVASVEHLGETGSVDRWVIPARRLVPLHISSPVESELPMELYLRIGQEPSSEQHRLVPVTKITGIPPAVRSGVTHFLRLEPIEGKRESASAGEPAPSLSPWSANLAHVRHPDRRLHLIHPGDVEVAAATLRPAELPGLNDPPLRVALTVRRLAPLRALEPEFGRPVALHLHRLLYDAYERLEAARRIEDESALRESSGLFIAGTVESTTGEFADAISVVATLKDRIARGESVGLRRATAPVRWSQQPDGRLLGKFTLANLNVGTYQLRVTSPRAQLVQPASVLVLCPRPSSEESSPTFRVKDGGEKVPLWVTVRDAAGRDLGGYKVIVEVTLDGATSRRAIVAPTRGVHSPMQPVLATDSLPVGASARIIIDENKTRFENNGEVARAVTSFPLPGEDFERNPAPPKKRRPQQISATLDDCYAYEGGLRVDLVVPN